MAAIHVVSIHIYYDNVVSEPHLSHINKTTNIFEIEQIDSSMKTQNNVR
jgi:hypothetical protein